MIVSIIFGAAFAMVLVLPWIIVGVVMMRQPGWEFEVYTKRVRYHTWMAVSYSVKRHTFYLKGWRTLHEGEKQFVWTVNVNESFQFGNDERYLEVLRQLLNEFPNSEWVTSEVTRTSTYPFCKWLLARYTALCYHYLQHLFPRRFA